MSNNYEKMEDLLRMHDEYKKKLEGCDDTKKNKKTVVEDLDASRKKGAKKGKKGKKWVDDKKVFRHNELFDY